MFLRSHSCLLSDDQISSLGSITSQDSEELTVASLLNYTKQKLMVKYQRTSNIVSSTLMQTNLLKQLASLRKQTMSQVFILRSQFQEHLYFIFTPYHSKAFSFTSHTYRFSVIRYPLLLWWWLLRRYKFLRKQILLQTSVSGTCRYSDTLEKARPRKAWNGISAV